SGLDPQNCAWLQNYVKSHLSPDSTLDLSVEASGSGLGADLARSSVSDESGVGPMVKRHWYIHKAKIYVGTAVLVLLLVLCNDGTLLFKSARSELTALNVMTIGL